MSDSEAVVFSEKRRAKRVLTPDGATTLLKRESGALDIFLLKDISMVGMLFCDENKREKYSTGLLVNDIYLNVHLGDLDSGNKFFIFIDQGKIVRSFIDEASQSIFYGVEFLTLSPYVKDRVMTLIDNISPETCQ